MSTDYLVASLPALAFGTPPAWTWERFLEHVGGAFELPPEWAELDAVLRNAQVDARGAGKWKRPVALCSLYWHQRVLQCFQEADVARRDELLDRVRWDAAGELTPPADPLGRGALATYAVRLQIALRRARISVAAGNAAFDRLTAETRPSF